MVRYENELGYAISFVNDDWIRLTPEQRKQFQMPNNCIDYFVSPSLQNGFMVVFDGYLKGMPLDDFFNLCVTNLKKVGATVYSEENFIGQGAKSMIKAKKTFSKLPSGITQTSYFLQLNKRGAVGCFTIQTQADHDKNESILVEAINNFELL